MTNQNITSRENKYEGSLDKLRLLVNQCNFEDAKTLADKLIAEGCWKPIICHTCYDTMQRLLLVSPQAAVALAREFKDYGFQFWLPDQLRLGVQ